jgi:hypothetical protein
MQKKTILYFFTQGFSVYFSTGITTNACYSQNMVMKRKHIERRKHTNKYALLCSKVVHY